MFIYVSFKDPPVALIGSLLVIPPSYNQSSSPKIDICFFGPLILKPWQTLFCLSQIKESRLGCQGPDQLSQATISTVLLWRRRKIWALSKAEGAVSQPSYLHPFHFTVTSKCLFVSRRLVSLYSHSLHFFTLCSLPLVVLFQLAAVWLFQFLQRMFFVQPIP